jgi:hypothetical protein
VEGVLLVTALPDLVLHQLCGYAHTHTHTHTLATESPFTYCSDQPLCDRWLSLRDALVARQASRAMRELVMAHHGAARLVLGFVVPQLLSVAGVPSSADFTSPAHSTQSPTRLTFCGGSVGVGAWAWGRGCVGNRSN